MASICVDANRKRSIALTIAVVSVLAAGCLQSDPGGDDGGDDAIGEPMCRDLWPVEPGAAARGWWRGLSENASVRVTVEEPPQEAHVLHISVASRPANLSGRQQLENHSYLFQYHIMTVEGRALSFYDGMPGELVPSYDATPHAAAFPFVVTLPLNTTYELELLVHRSGAGASHAISARAAELSECRAYQRNASVGSGWLQASATRPLDGPKQVVEETPSSVFHVARLCGVRLGEPVTELGETVSLVIENPTGNDAYRVYGATPGQPVPYGACAVYAGALAGSVRGTASYEGELSDARVLWHWSYVESVEQPLFAREGAIHPP